MLTHPTLDQMLSLGLAGMATAYRELANQVHGNLSFDERLGLMLDREIALRTDKRLSNRLRAAKLRFANASIEDIDFAIHRGLDRRNVLALAQGGWLKANENLILTGRTGTGKTWIACAFGRQAARLDDKLTKVQLLVMDDWGTHTLNDKQRLDLLEIFEERYRRKSTLITAQLPVAQWHDMIGDATLADAILDRVVHNAHRISLQGDSMRKKKAPPPLTEGEISE